MASSWRQLSIQYRDGDRTIECPIKIERVLGRVFVSGLNRVLCYALFEGKQTVVLLFDNFQGSAFEDGTFITWRPLTGFKNVSGEEFLLHQLVPRIENGPNK